MLYPEKFLLAVTFTLLPVFGHLEMKIINHRRNILKYSCEFNHEVRVMAANLTVKDVVTLLNQYYVFCHLELE